MSHNLKNINKAFFLLCFLCLLIFTIQGTSADQNISQNTDSQNLDAAIQPLASVTCGIPGFSPATNIAVGGAPTSISKGDFNNDGIVDLVTPNFNTNNISVLLGNSSGGFSAPVNLPTGLLPRQVVVDDFNNDGVLDLIVANRNSVNLSFFLGSTTTPGTFVKQSDITTGNLSTSLASGDFNNDGIKDLAVAVPNTSNIILVLLGNGMGGFSTTSLASVAPNFVITGDVNKDGKLDIIAASRNGFVSVFLGDGVGGFATPIITTTNSDSAFISAADLNQDGNLDIAVANLTTTSISILIGNGTGNFTVSTTSIQQRPNSADLIDLDLDGKLDLVVTTTSKLLFFKNLGSGNFSLSLPISFSVGAGATSVAVVDVNKDGKPDLAVSNQNSGNISILTNTFSRACVTPSFAASTNFPTATGSLGNTVGDFNLDGKQDVVVLNAGSNSLSVFLGNGTGSFAPAISVASGGFNPDNAAVADFNKDGKPDLVVTNRFSDAIAVLLGDGTGNFSLAATFSVGGTNPSSVSIADFNLDGNPDVVTGNVNGAGSISIFLGNGTTLNSTPTVITVGLSPSVITGDFNRDGKPDIAVAVGALNTINILLGNGTGTFPTTNTISSGGVMPAIQDVGDFNNDGILDLLITNFTSATGNVFLGNGAGSFTSGLSVPSAQRLRFADFNKDGKLDIFAGSDIGTLLKIVLGNGSGGTLSTVNLPFSFGNSFTLALADFNNDSRLDLGYVVFGSTNAFSIRLSNCIGEPSFTSVFGGTLQSTVVSTNFPSPLQVQVFDLRLQPVPNTSVVFTALDAAGASGTFPGNTATATVLTDSNGIATSPTITANAIVGSYVVVASANNGIINICSSFALTNVNILENANIYVADTLNNRIQRTTNDGASWSAVGFGPGTNLGQFNRPRSVVANSTGNLIFVADTANNRIQRSTDSGLTWSIIAASGLAVGNVNAPQGLAYNPLIDSLYIADTGNNRIQVVSNASSAAPITSVFANATAGTMVGQVNQPQAVAIDLSGQVYVADTGNNRIQVNTNGLSSGWAIFAGADAGTSIGKMNSPRGIYVTSTNQVYVADTGNNRIQVNTNGLANGWIMFMSPGIATGSVNAPQGVTVALSGNAFIGDTGNNRIQKKSISTGVTSIVGTPGTNIGQFNQPTGVR